MYKYNKLPDLSAIFLVDRVLYFLCFTLAMAENATTTQLAISGDEDANGHALGATQRSQPITANANSGCDVDFTFHF